MTRTHLLVTAGLLLTLGAWQLTRDGIAVPPGPVSNQPTSAQHSIAATATTPHTTEVANVAATTRTTRRQSRAVRAIIGQVVDQHGSPLANATVTHPAAQAVRTDIAGEFTLQPSQFEASFVSVHAEGMAVRTVPGVVAGTSLVIRMSPGIALHGRVLSSTGIPVQNAWVRGKWDTNATNAMTSEDGCFDLGGMPDAPVQLAIGGVGYETKQLRGYYVGSSRTVTTFVLTQADVLRGRVLSRAFNTAIAGATVTHSQTGHPESTRQVTKTDQHGNFVFATASVSGSRILVLADGFSCEPLQLAKGHQTDHLVVPMDEAAEPLRVTVLTNQGATAGLLVQALQDGQQLVAQTNAQGVATFDLASRRPVSLRCQSAFGAASGSWCDRSSRDLTLSMCAYGQVHIVGNDPRHAGETIELEAPGQTLHTTLDAEGNGTLHEVPPGPIAVHLGVQRLRLRQFILTPDSTFSVHIPTGITPSTFQVIGPNRAPIPGARWSCRPEQVMRAGTSTGYTDREGFGRADLYDGRAVLTVACEGYVSTDTVVDRRSPSAVVVRLQASPRIKGRVVDATTLLPVQQFVITTFPGRAETTVHSPTGDFRIKGQRIEGQPFESFAVRAVGWTSSALLAASSSEHTVVDLTPEGGVFGRILGPTDAPLQGIEVALHDANGDAAKQPVHTASDGSFRFSSLTPDRYQIVARSGGVELAAEHVVLAGKESQSNTTLRVPRLPSVHVLAYDGVKGPANGATLRIIQKGPTRTTRRSVTTDRDGYALLEGLIPGSYTLEARKGIRSVEKVVHVGLNEEPPLIEMVLPLE